MSRKTDSCKTDKVDSICFDVAFSMFKIAFKFVKTLFESVIFGVIFSLVFLVIVGLFDEEFFEIGLIEAISIVWSAIFDR